jgi:hypothetical protein
LIVQFQVLLQCGALRIAAGLEHAATLVAEMQAMRVKVTPAGDDVWRRQEQVREAERASRKVLGN